LDTPIVWKTAPGDLRGDERLAHPVVTLEKSRNFEIAMRFGQVRTQHAERTVDIAHFLQLLHMQLLKSAEAVVRFV